MTTSDDGEWVAVTASRGTDARNDAWLARAGTTEFTPISAGRDSHTYPFFDAGGDLYVLTNTTRRRWRACRVTVAGRPMPRRPMPGRPIAEWTDVVPEDPAAVLADVAVLADRGWWSRSGPGTRSAR